MLCICELVAACNEFFARRLDDCSSLVYFALCLCQLFGRFSDRENESIGKVRSSVVLSFRPARAAGRGRMTEMVLQNGVDRVGRQLKVFSGTVGSLPRGIGRKFPAGDVPDGLGDALSRIGKKGAVLCPRPRRGQVIFQINILWK
jgi:hypothetical protein